MSMITFAEIQLAYDALAQALLAYIEARVPTDGTTRVFRTTCLRLPHPYEEGQIARFHALRRIDDDICALGEKDENGDAGDELEPIPVAGFLLDPLYSIAGQLEDEDPKPSE